MSAAQSDGKADSSVSLQRYLDAITTLRLKIEAMTNSGNMDDQARRVAQAQFQGKSSELSDTRNYASLVAASLGEQWYGLGDSLFLRRSGHAGGDATGTGKPERCMAADHCRAVDACVPGALSVRLER